MRVQPGSLLTLDVEKAAAGGRMLARHEGQVVLVWGAVPGERVRARVERSGKGLLFAETIDVLDASPDRRAAAHDWRCGGNALAHVAYERQLRLKGEIVRDAFGRIAHVPLAAPPEVMGSPETGYRMRARLHVRGRRIGFLREGTHDLCDAAGTGQLLPDTASWIGAVERVLERADLSGLIGVEVAENVPGDERACHIELQSVEAARFAALAEAGPLTGLSAGRTDRSGIEQLAGDASVTDVLHARPGAPETALRLRRDVRAFFQANRFLLEPLLQHVVAVVGTSAAVLDLYAGVGLFGLGCVAAGADSVTLVEGDPVSGADLLGNALPFGDRVHIERLSVESFLHAPPRKGASDSLARGSGTTVVMDPPRTGVSKEALAGLVHRAPARIVYVSCDPPTLARDARALLDAGYVLEGLAGFDLFPNTAHVETVATFTYDTKSTT